MRLTVAVLNEVNRIRLLTTVDDLGTHEGNLESAVTIVEGIVRRVVRN
jgi:hypothetical protein